MKDTKHAQESVSAETQDVLSHCECSQITLNYFNEETGEREATIIGMDDSLNKNFLPINAVMELETKSTVHIIYA